MAAAATHDVKWLEERLSCSYCLCIFEDPQTFVCLHSLCKKCVHKLKTIKKGIAKGYECPVCRDFCDVTAVRHNFLLSELLDFYHMMSERGVSRKCKQCDFSESTHRCVECKREFCDSCKIFHDKLPLNKSHHWISLSGSEQGIVVDKLMFCEEHSSELLKLNCKPCEKPICYTCKALHHEGHQCETVEDAIIRIRPALQGNIDTLENHTQHIKKTMQEVRDRESYIHKSLDREKENLIAAFEAKKERVNNNTNDVIHVLEKRQAEIKCTTSIAEITLSSARGASLLQELQAGVTLKVKQSVDDITKKPIPTKSDIKNPLETLGKKSQKYVQEAVTIVTKNALQITVAAVVFVAICLFPTLPAITMNMPVTKSGVWSRNLHYLKDLDIIEIETVALNTYVTTHHIGLINNHVWIAVQKDEVLIMQVYTREGKLSYTFPVQDSINNIKAIVETNRYYWGAGSNAVATVCGESGAFTVTEQGEIIQTLSTEPSTDLCVNDGHLYVLLYKQRQVSVYSVERTVWKEMRQISIIYQKPSIIDTLQVKTQRNSIYIASWIAGQIYEYDLTGQRKALHGSKSNKAVGNLYCPSLCGTDDHGNMLVCNFDRQPIKILSADHVWSVTSLRPINTNVYYMLPIDEQTICILGMDDKETSVTFYRIQERPKIEH